MSIHHRRHRYRRTRERSAALLLVFAAMVFVFAAGGVLAFYFIPNPALLFGGGDSPARPNSHIEVDIEGAQFFLAERHVARIERSFLSGVRRVDLLLPWPFDPLALGLPVAQAPDPEDQIFITIEPHNGNKMPEERYEDIYKVYLEVGSPAEAGLKRFAFKPGSPYSDSELYLDETQTPPLIIRCDLQPSVLGPTLCERVSRLTEVLQVKVRFAKGHLAEWREIDRTALDLAKSSMRRAP